MASTSLQRTFGSEGNRKKWTWSAWIKRSATGSATASNGYTLWNCEGNNANDNFIFQITINGGGSGGTTDSLALHTYGNDVFRTTRKLADTNGWDHIVFALDTTQATATDRIKLYVNGDQLTYSQETNFPTQNYNMGINRAALHCIGSHGSNANYYFDGLMSHIHFCDGYQYAASDFGETNSVTGEWTIKTSPSVSYGTNGFFILKDGNSGTDQSPNSNDFTAAAGSLTKSEDCPNNIFCTFNPLYKSLPTGGLFNGNTTAKTGNGDSTWRSAFGTLAANSGKYYMEVKWSAGSHFAIGFASTKVLQMKDVKDLTDNSYSGGGYYYAQYGTNFYSQGSAASGYTSYSAGDILGLALDLDNNKMYVSINGTFQGSDNPATNTGGVSIGGDLDSFWTFGISVYSNSGVGTYDANFGNGYFGTTAVSSAGTNASNNGIFEYNVPSGFTALSTKGLNL